ncbi:Cyclic AMP-dependent transcription factor ATF-2 [Manis javanica]|nr:Cyclic AMP-dependent transcription factor ATF-2 [Manis javanica]
MIDNRFNELAHWDNPTGDRYSVELDIISVDMGMGAEMGSGVFPVDRDIEDQHSRQKIEQAHSRHCRNNFSSYVRDYDFSVLLPEYNINRQEFSTPDDFGDLHGKLFKQFARSSTYREHFNKPPVICISASISKTYQRTGNQHPVLVPSISKMSCHLRTGILRCLKPLSPAACPSQPGWPKPTSSAPVAGRRAMRFARPRPMQPCCGSRPRKMQAWTSCATAAVAPVLHGLEQVEGIDFDNKVKMGIRDNRYEAMVPQVLAPPCA